MSGVLILQFMEIDGPAYLRTWLARQGVASEVRLAGDGFPARLDGYAALALLGGGMSVNDDLPFLRTAERLIDQAIQRDKPVLGHCLGGQLMARTLGARVAASPAPEVGWHPMRCVEAPAVRDWFGAAPTHTVFHWHYEAFDLPAGAQLLASSDACPNQAFAIGPHLGLQFHVEVDAAKVDLWLSHHDDEYDQAQRVHDTVHRRERIRRDTKQCLSEQMTLADRIYARWAGAAGLISQ
ncbi:MAG TPA: type 1 glutamine amidotransferase [Burkholderiaceae bacterium]|nr:type 1 glutamine amidotransferase [Burkholderiaceae bacterium]